MDTGVDATRRGRYSVQYSTVQYYITYSTVKYNTVQYRRVDRRGLIDNKTVVKRLC